MPRFTIACLITGCLLLFGGMASCEGPEEPQAVKAESEAPAPEPVYCRVEVRSFIVAGRGRHLYLLIDCPDGYDQHDGRVEYTTAAYRTDYSAPDDRSGAARVAKMTAGRALYPFIDEPDDRFETEFEILLDQAICLQQDRVFMARYALTGTNSSSGLRRAMELCDCELPERITNAGGFFGDFPGIDQDPGAVIDREMWPSFGIDGEPLLPAPDDDFQPADAVG